MAITLISNDWLSPQEAKPKFEGMAARMYAMADQLESLKGENETLRFENESLNKRLKTILQQFLISK